MIVELWLRLVPDAKASAELGGPKAIQSDVGSCLRTLKDVATAMIELLLDHDTTRSKMFILK